jgi:hypothetical protein
MRFRNAGEGTMCPEGSKRRLRGLATSVPRMKQTLLRLSETVKMQLFACRADALPRG